MIAFRLLCAALLLLTTLIPGSLSASEEKYGADFLQQLTSAEANGMGESFAAYSTGARSLSNNPAGLTYTEGNELLINAHKLPRVTAVIMKQNANGGWEDYGEYSVEHADMGLISYALSLGRFMNLGMSFVYQYEGRFIRVNEEGKAVNSFPKDDLAFTLAYSLKITQSISAGLDIKTIRSKIPIDDGSSIGRARTMDVGLMHQVGKRVRVGGVLQNIGGKLSFNSPDAPSSLRRRLLIGAMYTVKDSENSVLSVSMDVNPPFDDGPRCDLGAELLYARRIALRIGYLRNTGTYYEPLYSLRDESPVYEDRVWIRKGITAGLGLKLGDVEIDLARTPRRKPILNSNEKLRLDKYNSVISLSCNARF